MKFAILAGGGGHALEKPRGGHVYAKGHRPVGSTPCNPSKPKENATSANPDRLSDGTFFVLMSAVNDDILTKPTTHKPTSDDGARLCAKFQLELRHFCDSAVCGGNI